MTEYVLDLKRGHIAMVGCGGTGSFAAEGLARLLLSYPAVKLYLIDGDRVEERNLGRQNFFAADLGKFKSEALAERLTKAYRSTVAYLTTPLLPTIAGRLDNCGVVVGCVDNAAARETIANQTSVRQWWVDSGNGNEHGQVVIGNSSVVQLGSGGAFNPEEGRCYGLPLPTLVHPELLVPAPQPSCAEAAAAGDQGTTINQFMALLVVAMVRRLLEGRLTWWRVYLDLESGSLRPVLATPESVSRLTGIRLKKLMPRGGKKK